jgi:serine/threonine protein phosphatase 1
MNQKHWAIGDVHGCGKTLEALLHQIQPGSNDQITFLGDLIDRGGTHRRLFDLLEELRQSCQIEIIRGNHEQAFLDALLEVPKKNWRGKTKRPLLEAWKAYGGETLLKEFGCSLPEALPDTFLELVKASVAFREVPEAFLVHAGFDFRSPQPFEDTHAMMWIRDFEVDLQATGGKRVVHGHVPVSLELIEQCLKQPKYGFVDIDNGCVYRDQPGMGNLIALNLSTFEITVQPNQEPYYS